MGPFAPLSQKWGQTMAAAVQEEPDSLEKWVDRNWMTFSNIKNKTLHLDMHQNNLFISFVSLGQLSWSCPLPASCAPPAPHWWVWMRSWKVTGSRWALVSNNWNIAVINIIVIPNPKYSTIPATKKKMYSNPAIMRIIDFSINTALFFFFLTMKWYTEFYVQLYSEIQSFDALPFRACFICSMWITICQ